MSLGLAIAGFRSEGQGMTCLASAIAALLIAVPVAAQTPATPPASTQTPSVSDLTRQLNGGPPFIAPAPAPAPVPAPPPAVVPAPVRTQTVAPAGPAVVAPVPAVAPAVPVDPIVEATVEADVAPAPSAFTPLSGPARAALPFSVDLPEGFEIGSGRPGPDFTVYSIRRDGTPFVMIYAGPASQFPIYDGQLAEVAGRATVVVTEPDGRHAMEHLFQRATAPREIHVWVTSLDGPERTLAEQIAQSVDVRRAVAPQGLPVSP
jgi:hypothetical protein